MPINKAMLAALSLLSYPELDVEKIYLVERKLQKLTARRAKKPWLYQIWEHTVSSCNVQIPMRIFSPKRREGDSVLLFFHGGGWVTGSIDSYDGICGDMAAQTGCVVASVDYRLAPEHRFPAAAEDCYAAAREVFLHSGLLGARPEDVVLFGDSAGGNLAAAVSLMARDRGEFLPRRQILIYPAVGNDHSETSPFPSVRENGTGYREACAGLFRPIQGPGSRHGESLFCAAGREDPGRSAGHPADYGGILPSAGRGRGLWRKAAAGGKLCGNLPDSRCPARLFLSPRAV